MWKGEGREVRGVRLSEIFWTPLVGHYRKDGLPSGNDVGSPPPRGGGRGRAAV